MSALTRFLPVSVVRRPTRGPIHDGRAPAMLGNFKLAGRHQDRIRLTDDAGTSSGRPGSKRTVLLLANLLLLAGGLPATAVAADSVHGTLIERHGDTLEGRLVDESFVVAGPHGQVPLTDPQPGGLIGQLVTVADTNPGRSGTQGQAHAVDPTQNLQSSPPPGPQSVLVLILTTPDEPSPAVPDAATAQARIFTDPDSAGAFYDQQTQGTTTLVGRVNPSGDVAGPIALGSSMAGCPYDAIAAEADQRATAMGYTPSAYDHVIYLMPYSGQCAFGGLGEMPGHRVWSNGYTMSEIIAHELGHNMGAHHANLALCTDQTGAATPYSATCTSREYGDPFDVMGSSGALMSAFHRYQIGQLPATQVVSLRQSGAVAVTANEAFALPGPRLVLVPIKTAHQPVHEYFALESRAALPPFDQWTQGDPVTTGLTIRKVNDSHGPILQTQLIDTHPSGSFYGLNAPLQPGETFTDAADGISITAATDPSGALLATVTMPTLVDDVPPSPPAQVSASGSTGGVHLSWTPGTDDVAVDHYQLTRDGVPVGTATGLAFDDPNVQSLTQTSYGVSSVDTSGNTSPPTTLTMTLPDATPPTPPVGLQAHRNPDGTTVLAWLPATDNRGVAGYRITQDGRDVGWVAGATAQVASDRHSHTFAVYARDAAGNESAGVAVAVGEQQTPTVRTPPGPGGRPGAAKLVLTSSVGRTVRLRGGRRVTVTFRAAGASVVRVLRGTRQIGVTHSGVISVSVLLRIHEHVSLRIIATGAAGQQSWTAQVR